MLDFQGVFLMFFVNIFWFRLPNFSGDLACQKNTLELQIGISMNQKRWTRVLPQQLSGWKQNRKPYILRLILDVNFRVWSWWAGKPWKRPLRILKAKLWTFASEDWVFFIRWRAILEPWRTNWMQRIWTNCGVSRAILVCIPWCPQTVCPNLGVQGGGTSCAECRPMQIPGMDQNLKSCDVRWNGMLLILTLGCFSPPWQWGKRWSLKDVGLLYCCCGSLEWWESIPSPNVLVSTKPCTAIFDVPGGLMLGWGDDSLRWCKQRKFVMHWRPGSCGI